MMSLIITKNYHQTTHQTYRRSICGRRLGIGKITSVIGTDVQIVGDDLFVTNSKRLDKGIKEKSANSILVKPNQIGT